MEALILVATSGGPMMFARIGIMRALNRGHVREFNPSRKDPHWRTPEAEKRQMTGRWRTLVRHLSVFQFPLPGRPRFLMFDR
jgi:hypothetical protein